MKGDHEIGLLQNLSLVFRDTGSLSTRIFDDLPVR